MLSTLTGDAAPLGNLASFREKAFACDYVNHRHGFGTLRISGAGHLWSVEPDHFLRLSAVTGAVDFVLAATLGAWLGASCFRLLSSGSYYSRIRLVVGCLLGGALGLIVAGPLVLGTPHTTEIPAIVLLVSAAIIPGIGAWWCGMVMLDQSSQQSAVGLVGFRWAWRRQQLSGLSTLSLWLSLNTAQRRSAKRGPGSTFVSTRP